MRTSARWFRPFVCCLGHFLEIDDVLRINQCGREAICRYCNTPVSLDLAVVRRGIKRAVEERIFAPEVTALDSRGRRRVVRIVECAHCSEPFETLYPTTKYHKECRNIARKIREASIPRCQICNKQIRGTRRRRVICSDECRAKKRRGDFG